MRFNFLSRSAIRLLAAALTLWITSRGWSEDLQRQTVLHDAADGVRVLVSGFCGEGSPPKQFAIEAQHAVIRGSLGKGAEGHVRMALTVKPRKTAFTEMSITLDEAPSDPDTETRFEPRRFEKTQGGLRVTGCLHVIDVPGVPGIFVSVVIQAGPGEDETDLAPNPVASCSVKNTGRGLAIQVTAVDPNDPNPAIWLLDSLSGFQAGPFRTGDVVLLTISPSTRLELRQLKGAGEYAAFLKFQGEPLIFAVNAAQLSSDPQLCR